MLNYLRNLRSKWAGKFVEGQLRTLAKMVTWRVFVTITNAAWVLLAGGSLKTALAAGFLALIFNSLLYYIHDRAWTWVAWDKLENATTGPDKQDA